MNRKRCVHWYLELLTIELTKKTWRYIQPSLRDDMPYGGIDYRVGGKGIGSSSNWKIDQQSAKQVLESCNHETTTIRRKE
jgi:hypothetical protein